jgi:hypothetical protein
MATYVNNCLSAIYKSISIISSFNKKANPTCPLRMTSGGLLPNCHPDE